MLKSEKSSLYVHETEIIQEIIEPLEKEPSQRKQPDIQKLSMFFRDNKFFKQKREESGEEAVNNFLKAMSYEHYDKDEFIVRIGMQQKLS